MAKYFNGITSEPEEVEVLCQGEALLFKGRKIPLNKLSISFISETEINLIIDGENLELSPNDPHFKAIHNIISFKKSEGVKKGLTYALSGFAFLCVSFGLISYFSERLPDEYYKPLINENFLVKFFPGTCEVKKDVNDKLLLALGEKDIRFFVIKLPAVNALAYPFNQILITEQMLLSLKNDHELFAVLGHEVGHLRLKHYKGQLVRMLFVDIIGSVLDQGQIGKVVETFLLNSYSRKHEREADKYSVKVMRKMHYPILAGASLMQILKEKVPEFGPAIFSSHPVTKERINYFLKEAGSEKKDNSKDRTFIKNILSNCKIVKGQ